MKAIFLDSKDKVEVIRVSRKSQHILIVCLLGISKPYTLVQTVYTTIVKMVLATTFAILGYKQYVSCSAISTDYDGEHLI
jgi:hypothetical protein